MNIVEMIKSILFGVVEGITEWLPISSTGHMILLQDIIPMKVSSEFWNMFLVVIQLGAILAVVLIFWNKIFPFQLKKDQPLIKADTMKMWFKIIVACLPAAIIGILFDEVLEKYLYHSYVVAIMLILFGIGFLVIENRNKGKQARVDRLQDITYRDAIMIGLFQLIAAIFPGTSRSGATILGGLIIGVSRTVSAEFTFFLAIPVMFGASLLKLVKFGLVFTSTEITILLVGMISAFLVSMIVIKFLMDYIKKHDFKVFGWYRIILGAILIVYFGLQML